MHPLAPATTYWCLAEPGRTCVVYVRGTKAPVTVARADAGGPNGASWKAARFDPRTGKSEDVPLSIDGGSGRARLTAPDEQDWVFVLRNAAKSTASK